MITSVRNPRIQAAVRLHRSRHRAETGRTLIEGPNLVESAHRAGLMIHDAFYLPGDEASVAGLEDVGVAVTPDVLAKVADTKTPRGPIAIVDIPRATPTRDDMVVLVAIGEPGNAGTIIRTAAAFGLDVLVTPGTVDVWSPKVLRAGAGAHFATSIVIGGDDWSQVVAGRDATTVALVPLGDGSLDALDGNRVAILVGAEAAGLPQDVVDNSDRTLSLPLAAGVESLNAAVAAGIAMFERTLRRPML